MKKIADSIAKLKPANFAAYSFAFLVICALMFTSAVAAFSDLPNAEQATALAHEESATEAARREFSRLPTSTSERLAAIKDLKLRAQAQRAYKAMKALVDNKTTAREAALLKEFDQAYLALFTPTQEGGYQSCTFKCKSDAQKCQSGCKKKFCGCKFTGFACFVAECVF